MHLKIRKVGNSLGVILPREVVAQLEVVEGDTLTLTEAADGYKNQCLRPVASPDRSRSVKKIMWRHRNTLRELAKDGTLNGSHSTPFRPSDDLQISEHGGADGLRDEGKLSDPHWRGPRISPSMGIRTCSNSRPLYAPKGSCRNHPFVDGNKRTAFLVVAVAFLRI